MKITLVDLGGLFWTLFFGLNARMDDELAATEAQLRAVGYIQRWKEERDRIAVAFDWKPYRRLEIDPSYKSDRKPKPRAATAALNATIKELRGHGITLLGQQGEEADDMIASAVAAITRHLEEQLDTLEIRIYSRDKDLLQLVRAGDPKIEVATFDDERVWNEGIVFAELGVMPIQVRDYLALIGDSSDGIKGVEGIGPKKALQLLAIPTTVPALLEGGIEGLPDELRGKISAALDSGSLERAYRLVSLNRGAAVDVEQLLGVERESQLPTEPPPEPEPTMPSQPEPMTEMDPSSGERLGSTHPLIVAAEPAEPAGLHPIGTDWTRQLEPRTSDDAKRLAKAVYDSRLFAAYGNAQAAFLVIMAGREFGLGAMTALRSFHIVEGRPCLSAQAMMGLCLRHPSCELFYVSEQSSKMARVLVQRKGWPRPAETVFTIEDAQQAGLTTRQNWRKYPRAMLTNRAIAEAARFGFPDIVGGLYDPEELAGQ